jgi:hypothetical protein
LVANGQKSAEIGLVIGPVLIGRAANVISRGQLNPQSILSIKFGRPPVILLHGYNLQQDETGITVTLYWECLAQTPTNWTIFAHLRNQAGEIVSQKDGPAGSGYYPPTFWRPGEFIVDKLAVPLPQPSARTYNLFVGLYDPVTQARLAVPEEPANEVILASGLKRNQ